MSKTIRILQTALSVAMLVLSLGMIGAMPAAADDASIAEGKKVAFDRKKGNCLACHMMSDGALPGNIGPPLIAMKARFPDRQALLSYSLNSLGKRKVAVNAK